MRAEQFYIENSGPQLVGPVFNENESEFEKNVGYKSEIEIQIFDYEIIGLLDIGSDITCISEEIWNDLKRRHPEIPCMPVNPFYINTAVGHKSMEIRQMGLVPTRLGKYEYDIGFLIVPGLSRPLILGFDWMKTNEVIVSLEDPTKGIIIWKGGDSELVKFFEQSIDKWAEDNAEINLDLDTNNESTICENIKTGVILQERDKRDFEELNRKYESLFSSELGRANCYGHVVTMETSVPIVRKTYPIPYAYREKVENKLREMETLGIISRSSTPYCSPLTFTLNKDGTFRVLLDAREINKYTETEKPPVQLDVLNSFHGAKFIIIIDLNIAYFQIPISEESKRYTGFMFNGKSYVYNVLPQGLKTSVGSFSRAMDKILGFEVRDYCVNYLDDLASITTGSLQEHLKHIDIVLNKLAIAGLTCNLKKCEFLCERVNMLGYIISTEGIKTDPEKVESIQKFPVPKKFQQLRAFLGLCNFYRRFISRYNIHTQSLYNLFKKGKVWQWGVTEQQIFDKIKGLFVSTIQLHHPDFDRLYYLQTDCSGIGLAGALYQIGDDSEMKILGFHSKALKGAQLNWTVTEQEFYSVIC